MPTIVLVTAVVVLFALFIGLPVATALGISGLALGALFVDRPIWQMFGQVPWNITSASTIIAVPLFVLMGEILARSGVTEDMYAAVAKWLNRLPGGLLHTNVVASGIFAAVSGSSAATAATICSVAVPALRKRGYDESLALGSIAAGGTLGILIPPSIIFIVYGVLVEESIGRLYIAGIVPGIVMMLAFMLVIFLVAHLNPKLAPRFDGDALRLPSARSTGMAMIPIAVLVFVVLGTIYLGVATASEAAAFGATGAFVITLMKRRVNKQMLKGTFIATALTTSMIVFILFGAFTLQFVISYLGLPAALSQWLVGLGLSATQFVIIVCAMYFVMGMFVESLAMVVTTVPILVPILHALHIDLVWFGVIMVINVELSLITPPVGMNLFVVQGIRTKLLGGEGRPITDVYRGVLPFIVAMIAVLSVVIAAPELSLWLVHRAK